MNGNRGPLDAIPEELSRDAESLAEQSLRIGTPHSMRRFSNSSLVAVRHAIPFRIEGTDLIWDIGPMFSRVDELLGAQRAFLDRLIRASWQINSFVALSAPASALTTLLATSDQLTPTHASRVHYWDNYSVSLSTDHFEPHENVLLVDTLVRTGLHLATAYDYIEARGGQIAGVITLCLGVSRSSDLDDMHPRVPELLAESKLLYIYSWGQLQQYAERPEVRARLLSKVTE
jgi:hypothetical protein